LLGNVGPRSGRRAAREPRRSRNCCCWSCWSSTLSHPLPLSPPPQSHPISGTTDERGVGGNTEGRLARFAKEKKTKHPALLVCRIKPAAACTRAIADRSSREPHSELQDLRFAKTDLTSLFFFLAYAYSLVTRRSARKSVERTVKPLPLPSQKVGRAGEERQGFLQRNSCEVSVVPRPGPSVSDRSYSNAELSEKNF
jgi:hypothetical protein